MEVRDSRRLTGPNVLWERPGAILDVALEDGAAEAAVAAWRREARRALDAVGWGEEDLAWRVFPGGVNLALSAPVDALYAATEVNEWAWEAAAAVLAGRKTPDLEEAAARLEETIAAERNPALIALREGALKRRVTFLSDDERASVGSGTGSLSWPVDDLPAPPEVDWDAVHDVPIALVTGTNGKTTTVRLLAAIAAAAGRTAGVSTTDWIRVGSELIDEGDYSGPGGARAVLRDRRVEVAFLETARGGMLRRGLAVSRADVACVTNVAEDHLGEWGVAALAALADAKFVVGRAAERLVLNADDPMVRERGPGAGRPVTWFSLDPRGRETRPLLAAGDTACAYDGRALRLLAGYDTILEIPVERIPIALGGAARHNVANALAAIGVARAVHLPAAAIAEGLEGFESTPEANPGRLNVFDVAGLRVVVDFAHNPHGVAALLEMAMAMPAERRLVLLGQAGDRDDDAIRELARIAWRARPDRIVVKELRKYLRGRAEGEVPGLLISELRAAGAPPEALDRADSELQAVRQAFEWSRPGDLLLLVSHSNRAGIIALIERLRETGWRPDRPLPA